MAAQQKFDKAVQSYLQAHRDKVIQDVIEYISDECEEEIEVDADDIIKHFNELEIKEKPKKKGKTTNYHRFMKIKTEELKGEGFKGKGLQTEARKYWKELSDDDKKKYDEVKKDDDDDADSKKSNDEKIEDTEDEE